ncbi:MAG: tetratricopeptide repeat protein [Firmicutes bacterium]|nr:tetratricopeptide repeat protein [Bacillota bacterium]
MPEETEKTPSPAPAEYEKKFQESEIAFSRGDYDKAKEYCLELTIASPDYENGWFGLSKVYYVQENFAESAKAWKKCHRISSHSGLYHKLIGLGAGKPGLLFGMSKALYEEGMNDDSLKFTDKLVEMEIPQDMREKVIMLRDELHKNINKEQLEAGEALKKGEKNVNFFLKSTSVIIVLIIAVIGFLIYKNIQRTPLTVQGKAAFKRAMGMMLDFRDTEKGHQADKAVKEFDGARSLFQKALAKNPNDAEAHYYLARTFQEMSQLNTDINSLGTNKNLRTDFNGEIEVNLKKAIELDPNYADAYLALASQRLKEKNYTEGKELLNQTLQKIQVKYGGSDPDSIARKADLTDKTNNLLNWVDKQQNQTPSEPGKTTEGKSDKKEKDSDRDSDKESVKSK